MAHPGLGYVIDDLDITDPSLYASVLKPFGKALKLPALAYQSKTFSDLEDENIWSRSWVAIGSTHQIPHPGDMLPYTIGHHGIHVQRLNSNTIIGRFNKAQHGGCRAVPAQCQTGNKTKCSFTSCGYSLDSKPINNIELEESTAIAHQYLGVVPERLLTAKTYQLGSYIFVNLDPELSDTSEPDLNLSSDAMHLIGESKNVVYSDWVETEANWKLLCNAVLTTLDPFHKQYGMESSTNKTPHVYQSLQVATDRIFQQSQDYPLIWISPNLFILLLENYTISLIIQPTGLKQSLIRVLISSNANEAINEPKLLLQLNEFIDQVTNHANDSQKEFNKISMECEKESGKIDANSLLERSTLGDYFNKFVAQKITKRHEYYWNVPLFKNVL